MTEVVDHCDKNTEEENNKNVRNDEMIDKHDSTSDEDLETGMRTDESFDSDVNNKPIISKLKVAEEEKDDSEPRLFPDLFYCPITGEIFKDPVVIADGCTYERAAIMKRHQEEKEKEKEKGNVETTSVTTTITTTTITNNENGTTTTTTTQILKGDEADDATKTVDSNEKSNYDDETDNDEEQEKKPEVLYYPNRALLSIIQESKKYQQSFFKRVESNTRCITGTILDRVITSATSSSTASSLQESQLVTTFRPLPDGYYCPITFGILHDPVIDPEGNTFEHAAVYNWIRVHGTSPVTRSQASIEDLFPNRAIRELLEQEKKLTGMDDEEGGYDESLIHPSIRKWKTEEAPKISDADVGGDLQPSDDDEENYRRISCCYWMFIMFVLCVFIPVFCCVSCCCPGYFNIIEEEEEDDEVPLFEIEEEDVEAQELDRENIEATEQEV